MKKNLLLISLMATLGFSNAQVGISSNTSDTPEATLDVRALEGNTPDGILIPRVDKGRAQSMATPENSTLAWINNTGTGGSRTVDVDADGFYYYDDGQSKWVKLGGSTSTTQGVYKPIRTVENLTIDEWKPNDYTIVITDGSQSLALPDPTTCKGRIIAVRNDAAASKSWSANPPKGNGTLRANSGQYLQSDGEEWFVIGGF